MINVNMNSNLQGIPGWDQLAGMLKAGETKAAGGTAVNIADNQIVVTVSDGKSAQSISISVPDLGSVESAPDVAALQDIVEKVLAVANSLVAAGAIGADGTAGPELQAAISRLQSSLAAFVGSASADPSMNMTNTSKVLFDLFALMALMVEVAQKERDTSREIRLVENQQVQNSIKQQADDMRNAALISLGFGIATTIISGAMSIASMTMQSKAFCQQTSATKQMDVPTQNLASAELALNPKAAEANLQSVTQKTSPEIQQKVTEQFGAAKDDFVRDITAADTRLQQAETAQDTAADELTALKAPGRNPPATQEEIAQATSKYDRASEDVIRAKQNRSSIERGFFEKLDTQIKANDATMGSKQELLATKEAALKKASGDEATQLKGEITTLKNEVAAIKGENSYLRAYTSKLKADHASDGMKNADLARAQSKYDYAKQNLQMDARFVGSQQMMNRWIGIQQLSMTLSQMTNAAGSMVGETVRAKATMEGVEQTQHNEQLDQIKDLFSQAETVVQAVIQLMQAVLSAENESIMEAIRV